MKTRQTSTSNFLFQSPSNPGEKVYFKRRKTKGCSGPAKVLGKESNFVLIRHGSAFYRCHPCQLLRVNPVKGGDDSIANPAKSESSVKKCFKNKDILQDDKQDQQEVEQEEENEVGGDQERAESEREQEDEEIETERLKDNSTRPKRRTMIEYMLQNGDRGHARVLAQQPKRTGVSKRWVNVRTVKEDEDSSINWEEIRWWRETESEQVLILNDYQETDLSVTQAKEKEMERLENNNVFEWVEYSDQDVISSKWVLTEKQKEDGSSFMKARLVARGYEEDSSGRRTDSPTCSKQSLRMLFTVASSMSWELNSIDITAAFLQGNDIERDVFIQPPVECIRPGQIWKLRRCIYGLCDAPRNWYDRVHDELRKLGGSVSQYDKLFFSGIMMMVQSRVFLPSMLTISFTVVLVI